MTRVGVARKERGGVDLSRRITLEMHSSGIVASFIVNASITVRVCETQSPVFVSRSTSNHAKAVKSEQYVATVTTY